MAKREPVVFIVIKLAIWAGGMALFFRFLMYFLSFIGGDIHELWMPVAGVSSICFVFWGWLLWQWHLPSYKKGDQTTLFPIVTDSNQTNAIATTKDTTTMPDKPHIYIDKVMNINHGTINQNTPGGTMNFGPVTYNPHPEVQQTNEEPAQEKPQHEVAETIGDDETIDIAGLIEFSKKLKSPGVSRSTIDNILKKAGIKPCATEKDGRTIRNLYPREKTQAAIASYLADRDI